MPTAFVQGKSAVQSDNNDTVAATFDSSVTTGNLIAVSVAATSASVTLSSVTDSQSNVYTIVDTITDSGNGARGYTAYAANVTGGASFAVTATLSGAAVNQGIIIHEISGARTVSPLDANIGNAQTNPGTGTDAVTSTADTTTVNGCYIFGATWETDLNCGGTTAGTGFTSRIDTGCSNLQGRSEDQIQAAAGSIAVTFTNGFAVTDNVTMLMAFSPPATLTTEYVAPLWAGGAMIGRRYI